MSAADELLRVGVPAPEQTDPNSCGAACLVMARMLADPVFASWLTSSESDKGERSAPKTDGARPPRSLPHRRTPGGRVQHPPQVDASRWAQAQRQVRARTNAIGHYPGLVQAPWPASLGTPPWGARVELERHCSGPNVSYETVMVRTMTDAVRGRAFDTTVAQVGVAAAALVYVGNYLMPRHIVLWAQPSERSALVQYDPFDGSVRVPSRAHFVGRRLGSAGWDVPWLVLRPDAATPIPGADWRQALLPATLSAAGA